MEDVGMTMVRTYWLTPNDLQPGGDVDDAGIVLFDGEDGEYAIDRAVWERQRQHATTGTAEYAGRAAALVERSLRSD